MMRLEISPETMEQLHYERRYHPHPRVRQRMEAVYLKAMGYPHQEIGRIVGISQKTLRSYLQMYQTGGIEGLKVLNFYRPQSDLADYREQLKAEFEARPAKSINEAVQRIEKLTGIRRSPTQVRQFLKQLGLKRLKVGHIPAKQKPLWQKTLNPACNKPDEEHVTCSLSMRLIS